MIEEQVILVDQYDKEIGQMGKMEVHEKGLLHRAFSIFIFNEAGELLIQQRALGKYHCPGLWTNTCCSHPRPGETVEAAADRRLYEEMGFSTELSSVFSFVYRAKVGSGLVEHELDHVFVGKYQGEICSNPDEVNAYRFISVQELLSDVEINPGNYTPWFKVCLPQVIDLKEKWAA